MILEYCIYKGEFYKFDITDDDKIELTSRDIQDKSHGFTEYVDVLGNIDRDILVKTVSQDELEMAYEMRVNAIYEEREFEIYTFGNDTLEENKLSLFSMDSEDVDRYGFEKKEQFVFEKEVRLDSLEGLVEIKTPILRFENYPQIRKVIPKDEITDYIRGIINLLHI